MKTTIAATVAAVALAAAVPLGASAGDDDRRGGHGMRHAMGGGHGKGHHGERGHRGAGDEIRMLELIETYDGDGDGSVTQAEIDRWRADRLAEFDADADGRLSLDEYERLWLDAMRERMVDRFQSHDDDGDGEVTVDEFGQPAEHIVLRMDRDDDGALSLEDLERRRGDRPSPADAAGPEHGAGETEQQ